MNERQKQAIDNLLNAVSRCLQEGISMVMIVSIITSLSEEKENEHKDCGRPTTD